MFQVTMPNAFTNAVKLIVEETVYDAIAKLAEKYGFDSGEALAFVMGTGVQVKKEAIPRNALPWCNEVNGSCQALENEIRRRFEENVKGKPIVVESNHCGKEGHWLETQMGISHNSLNQPDLFGYEMKHSSRKITLGDFSANEYAYSKKRPVLNGLNDWTDKTTFSRSAFIQCFGNPNPEKNDRYSWSGQCVPKYNTWNSNGQTLLFTEENDLLVHYSYEKDRRLRKEEFPEFLKKDTVIAIWKKEKLKRHVEQKFNQRGFFLCQKTGDVYDEIRFGRPFDYPHFVECIKNNTIIFDSGMYEGNSRNYSHFRGSVFWKTLLI